MFVLSLLTNTSGSTKGSTPGGFFIQVSSVTGVQLINENQVGWHYLPKVMWTLFKYTETCSAASPQKTTTESVLLTLTLSLFFRIQWKRGTHTRWEGRWSKWSIQLPGLSHDHGLKQIPSDAAVCFSITARVIMLEAVCSK